MDVLTDILKDSSYALNLFKLSEIQALRERIVFRETRGDRKPHVTCLIRNKEILLKPEEIVRQLYLSKLINHYNYPKNRITVEHPVSFGRQTKYADIVVFDRDRPMVEYIIVELKKPKLQDGKNQLRSYCNATGAQSVSGQTVVRFPTTIEKTQITLRTLLTSQTPTKH